MSCTDKALALIQRAAGDPSLAWSILQEKYCATDAEENFPELSEAFGNCKLNETKKDPELWFNYLDHLNMRITRINTRYERDKLQMKSHIMTSMSSGYDPVVLKYRGELAETLIAKLRKEITLQYKALLKGGNKNKSESAMVANVNKHPYKKFRARNCGKIGHKADECRERTLCEQVPKTKNGENSEQYGYVCGVAAVEIGETIIHATETHSTEPHEISDTFFDDWADDSWDEEHGFVDVGEFESFFEGNPLTENLMPLEPAETPYMVTEEQSEYVNTVTITEEFVGSVGVDGQEKWLLDSGATCGVTYDKSNMTEMRASDKMITIGNGAQVATLGQGTVSLMDAVGNLVTLTDVYYAPKFTKHIVSLRKLIDDDWKLDNADKAEFVLTDPNTTSSVRFERNNNDQLYYLSGTRTSGHDVEAVIVSRLNQ
ncbi:hypothetical protein MHU86_2637 [Fragilaria crotonensis]|nr:hypothetical protein MHU86_2637 [Fragilaria crotonensis]